MRVANTVELKNKTNELLHIAMVGEPVIITLRGKPAAALTPLREEDLEAFVSRYTHRSERPPSRESAPEYRYSSVPSPFGPVYIAYGDQGIFRLDLGPSAAQFASELRRRLKHEVRHDPHPPTSLRRMLDQTLSEGRKFSGPVDLSMVGPFERRVLEQLREIPRGEVRTYLDIAKRLGYPGAVRAVGNACARNPIPLLIPCHRVIRSDGGLGGYSLRGGVSLKRRLLREEGADMSRLKVSN
jgi:methylated-DNA-[protein]-cysteine S-methyltransferase